MKLDDLLDLYGKPLPEDVDIMEDGEGFILCKITDDEIIERRLQVNNPATAARFLEFALGKLEVEEEEIGPVVPQLDKESIVEYTRSIIPDEVEIEFDGDEITLSHREMIQVIEFTTSKPLYDQCVRLALRRIQQSLINIHLPLLPGVMEEELEYLRKGSQTAKLQRQRNVV